jgi:hypothetical protein
LNPYLIESCTPIETLKGGFPSDIGARNSNSGVWWPEKQSFIIHREKFGRHYLLVEFHWDTGEPFGTVKPLHEIGPFDVPLKQLVSLYADKPGEDGSANPEYLRALDLLAPNA